MRYIGKAVLSNNYIHLVHDELYTGRFPGGEIHNSLEDSTLRMAVYKRQLYFPRGRGLSLYRGKAPAGEKPKELLAAYTTPVNEFAATFPITKFAVGDDFMVCQTLLQGFQLPMLCIFRPEYDQTDDSTQISQLQLDYICYPPKFTGNTLLNGSLDAKGNQFAITNSAVKKVFVYGINLIHSSSS